MFKKVLVTNKTNRKWERIVNEGVFTIQKEEVFAKDDRFYTIGSCFAEEVRKSLTKKEIEIFPKLNEKQFSFANSQIDTLPHREHLNFYNTFSILQEIQNAIKPIKPYQEDVWTLDDTFFEKGKLFHIPGKTVYQSPYRRMILSNDYDEYSYNNNLVSEAIREGIHSANVFVITLGLTEVFFNKQKLAINGFPGYLTKRSSRDVIFRNSSFTENLENLKKIRKHLKTINPQYRIIVTVSPVPLQRTFTDQDIYVANMRSKSVLRAAADAFTEFFDDVTYLPTYEYVSSLGTKAFKPDLRHIEEYAVDTIMEMFMRSKFVH